MTDDELKEEIKTLAIDRRYVTPRSVCEQLNIEKHYASKLIHELEMKGELEESWVRVYTPKKSRKVEIEGMED